MAYAVTNPPEKTVAGLGGTMTIWTYSSADAHTDVDAAGYFTDGAARGLKTGDLMLVKDTATPTATIHYVLNATTIAAATLA